MSSEWNVVFLHWQRARSKIKQDSLLCFEHLQKLGSIASSSLGLYDIKKLQWYGPWPQIPKSSHQGRLSLRVGQANITGGGQELWSVVLMGCELFTGFCSSRKSQKTMEPRPAKLPGLTWTSGCPRCKGHCQCWCAVPAQQDCQCAYFFNGLRLTLFSNMTCALQRERLCTLSLRMPKPGLPVSGLVSYLRDSDLGYRGLSLKMPMHMRKTHPNVFQFLS